MIRLHSLQSSFGRAAAQQHSKHCLSRLVYVPAAVHFQLRASGSQIAAVTTLQPQHTRSGQHLQQEVQQPSSSSRPGPPEEDYTSSPQQQAIVVGAAVLFAAVELRGLSQINSPLAALQCGLAAFAGYIIAGEISTPCFVKRSAAGLTAGHFHILSTSENSVQKRAAMSLERVILSGKTYSC